MKTRTSVIGVVKHKDKILFLKRNQDRKSSPGKWQTVSGFIKEYEPAEETVLREVKEETGLEGEIEESGDVFEVTDEWGRVGHYSLLSFCGLERVEIDLRHSEYNG